MTVIEKFADVMAVEALTRVTQKWLNARGIEAYFVITSTLDYSRREGLAVPDG